jgi:GDP-D-mannose dehydratase
LHWLDHTDIREERGDASKAALLLGWKARLGMHDIVNEMVAAELKLYGQEYFNLHFCNLLEFVLG